MSDQTDDAQYYIGETHYLSGRYEEAVNAYNEVIQGYPDSNSTPAAYFKGGLALERLGDLDSARTSWEFLLETYPDSDAGRLAKQALDRTFSSSL
jgi:TolA-binding protein